MDMVEFWEWRLTAPLGTVCHLAKVYLIDESTLKAMDILEGVHRGRYRRCASWPDVSFYCGMIVECFGCCYMGVSKNRGTPKSSILNHFSINYKPSILGVPLFLETPICA